MTLSHLLPQLNETRGLAQSAKQIGKGEAIVRLADMPLSSRPGVIAALTSQSDRPVLIVTAREDRAAQLADAIGEFIGEGRRIEQWPGPEALPYEQLPFDLETSSRRVAILSRLVSGSDSISQVITASAHGLSHLVFTQNDLREHTRILRVGDRLNVDDLIQWAVTQGYQPSPLVQEPGTVARRGGIIDLFPPA